VLHSTTIFKNNDISVDFVLFSFVNKFLGDVNDRLDF